MRTLQAEQITPPLAYHGEGSVWWQATGEIRFVDMLAGAVIAVRPDGSSERIDIGSPVAACLRPRVGGGAVLARERDIAVARKDDLSDLTSLTGDFIPEGMRFNEGNCDPDGRFYAGTMAYDRTPHAATLYWVGADGVPMVAVENVTTSNGLGFSPDARLAYYNDSGARRTVVYDYDSQTGLNNPRPFVDQPKESGSADGLCVDAEGGVWVAKFRGGVVQRFTPDGVLDVVVEVPAELVTSCAFGGPDLSTLYITTSREGLDDPPETAGALFVSHSGFRGQQPLPFRC